MAITVDWPNKIINVPKADLGVVQLNPTEIYELDLNAFRLTLKDLEDDDQGMVWVKTHNHNAPVNVGGVSLARVVSIINDYTVTFEDGQYAVNLFGANSNLGDRVNVNQVSVRSANSAGLIQGEGGLNAVQTREAIWDAPADTYLGAGTMGQRLFNILSDTEYLTSNYELIYDNTGSPLVSLSDMVSQATEHRSTQLRIINDLVIDLNINSLELIGSGLKNTLTNLNGFNVDGATFRNMRVTGTMTGKATFYDCELIDVTGFDGVAHRCGLDGVITPASGGTMNMFQCYSTVEGTVTLNFINGGPASINNQSFSGIINIINMTNANLNVGVGSDGGYVFIDNTNTAGTITLRGTGILDDQSAGTTVINEMVSNSSIASRVWDEARVDHLAVGTMGEGMSNILADTTQLRLDVIDIDTLVTTLLKYESNRTRIDKTAKTLTVYDDDDVTPIKVFDLKDSTGTPSVTEVTERVPQ